MKYVYLIISMDNEGNNDLIEIYAREKDAYDAASRYNMFFDNDQIQYLVVEEELKTLAESSNDVVKFKPEEE